MIADLTFKAVYFPACLRFAARIGHETKGRLGAPRMPVTGLENVTVPDVHPRQSRCRRPCRTEHQEPTLTQRYASARALPRNDS